MTNPTSQAAADSKPAPQPSGEPRSDGPKSILLPLDFSPHCELALAYAGAFCGSKQTAVTLLHVIESTSALDSAPPERAESASAQLRDEALNHLEMLSIGRLPPELVAKSEVRFGVPWRVIDDAARDSKPDLVILTTKGLGGVQHVSLGRTAERVGTNAPAPVLIIAMPGHEPLSRVLEADELEQALSHRVPSSKRRILVPIDFSSASEGALHYAVTLADAFGADLTLLHVVDSGAAIRHESLGENERDHYRLAEERLQELWRRRLPDSMRERVTLVFRTGVPWVEICAAARELAADWLFLTTEGFTNLRRVFLGKTADRVLRNAPCTVLVLREKEHHQIRPPGFESFEGSAGVHREKPSSAIPDRQQEATNAKSQASEA